MSRSSATPVTRYSELNLALAVGQGWLLAGGYGVCALLIGGFYVPQGWLLPLLLSFFAAGLVVQLWQRRKRRQWQLRLSSGRWLFCRPGQPDLVVAVEFPYVTAGLVVVGLRHERWRWRRDFALFPVAASGDDWRRLHVLIKDGEQLHSGRQS